MADRLELEARFKDSASAGVKRLGKTLESVKPSRGMDAANAWMKSFRKEADDVLRAARPVSSVLGGIGVAGLAAGFSLREIVKQARELADSTLNMRELGRQSSMTADQIRQLQYAAGKLHVDPSAMSSAIGSWSSKMVEFKRHLPGIYTDLMRQNADVARKIEADSPVDALKDALRFLSQIKDPQIQKRWADDFGLGDLAPMLSKGAAGLDAAFAEAGREVKPLTKDMVDAAERLNDATNKLDTTWGNFKNEFGPIVIDGVSGAVEQFRSVLKDIEGAKDRYSGHPENVTKDAIANENAIGGGFLKHWKEVFRGERPILPNPLDSRSWHFPNPKDGLFDYTKGGDGEAPSGIGFSKTNTTQRGEDGNALRRGDNDLSPAYRAALRDRDQSRPSASDKWKSPARYETEARARALGLPVGHDLKEEVREGSKQGIIQGLRELAQQQELNGGPGSGTGAGAGDVGGGLRNLRYGRSAASGSYRRTVGGKYDLSEGGLGSRAAIAGKLFTSKAPGIASRLKQDFPGLSDEDTAAILGNLGHESGGFKEFEEAYGKGPGRGWAQWTDPGRKARFFEFAKEHGLDPHSDDANYGFLRWELTHTHKSAMDALRRAQGLRAKTRAFEGIFEGAGVKNYPSRDRYADSALAAIHGAAPSGQAPSPAGTSSAAVGDAAAFAARQRLLNGGRDPADRALVDRYKAQQAKPEGHRAGGWIKGPGGPTGDRVPAMLSNGEYVVNARASGQWAHLLHAINSGDIARFADGGPVGFGVARQFYPASSPGISDAEGAGNRRFWRDFMRKPRGAGGMGASWRTTIAALAMMQGESGRGLNSKLYGWDVNGPSGGIDQLHDVTVGKYAGKLHRLSDLMKLGMQQHADWRDPYLQAANFKREALGSMSFAWQRMASARSTTAALKQGIDKFENPANHQLELLRRMPNIVKLQREAMADGAVSRHEIDPVELNIRHHPHTGHPTVTARAGKGVKLDLRSGPTMRSS